MSHDMTQHISKFATILITQNIEEYEEDNGNLKLEEVQRN